MSIEAVIANAEEQWEFAGTDRLGFDSYVHNILNAFVGDRVLYEEPPKCSHRFLMNGRDQCADCDAVLGWFVKVWPKEAT